MRRFLIALLLLAGLATQHIDAQYSRGMSRHHGYTRGRSYADLVEVNVREPGTLEERVPREMIDRVRMLRVEGPLNERDLAFITKLAKRSKVVNDAGKSVSNYLDVDLEYASVMEKRGSRIDHDVLPRRAFEYASRLRSIVLPERLKAIGERAFGSCSDLEEVLMPSRVLEFGERAFEGCDDLKYIELPARLERIGERCFKGCTSLTRLNLPTGLESIGKEAFDDCKLTEFYIPRNCVIDNNQLGELPYLQRYEVAQDNNTYSSLDGALYDRDGVTLLRYPAARTGQCRVPDGVEVIAASAFSKCKVSDVTLPATLTRLGQSAFYSCSRLTSISLPDGVVQLPAHVFRDCSALRQVVLGDINLMGEHAFSNCSSLQSITLTGRLSVIAPSAFEYCKALETVNLPAGIVTIDKKAFHECNALRKINLGDNLAKIASQAFDRCYSLTAVVVPASVSELGEKAFYECKSLQELQLNEGLLRIGNNALRETAIRHLVIPSTVSHIGKKITEKCKSLLRIECHATTPPSLDGVSNDKVELFVPAQALDTYRNDKNWKKFKVIKPL